MIREYKPTDLNNFRDCVMRTWYDPYVMSKDHRIWIYEYSDPYWYESKVLLNTDYVVLINEEAVIRGDSLFANKRIITGFMVGKLVHDYMDIIALYVLPEFREKGIAMALKNQLRDVAESMGLSYIQALNRYDNPKSLNLNRKAGWILNRVSEDYYLSKYHFGKKTIKEWEDYFNFLVLDPDGFDRTDPDLYKRKFKQRDFYERSLSCTISLKPDVETKTI